MVKQSFSIKAELEEITNIIPQDSKIWFAKLKCSSCGEKSQNAVALDPNNHIEYIKSTVNLLIKCKLCNRENSVIVEPLTNATDRTIESEEWFEVVKFECRGVEIEEIEPRRSFVRTFSNSTYSSKSILNLTSTTSSIKYENKRYYGKEVDNQYWLLEDFDTSKLRDDHPGYPFSRLKDESLPDFTFEEVARHNKREDCWIIINEKVYNVTSYVSEHPGGDAILQNAGKDSTSIFEAAPMSSNAWLIMKDFLIGYCPQERRFDGYTIPNRHDDHGHH
eukprot:gene5263-6553_t